MTENKQNLVDVAREEAEIESLLNDAGGDLEALPQEKIERLGELMSKSTQKVDAYARFIREWEIKIEGIQNEINRLQDRKRVFENKIKARLRFAEQAMLIRKTDKLEGTLHDIVRQKNGGCPSVKLKPWVIPKDLPARFLADPEPDMEAIREAALNGDEEANKFVEVKETGWSVRIK